MHGYVLYLPWTSAVPIRLSANRGWHGSTFCRNSIRWHFRDKRWQVRVNPVQELVLQVRAATWRLAQELGRTPAESDMAWHLGVSGNDLRQARRAELAFWPYSLDAPLPGQPGMITLSRQHDPEEHPAADGGPAVAP